MTNFETAQFKKKIKMSYKYYIYIITIIISGLFISCSNKVQRDGKPLFFPTAPDKPKIQFLKVIKNSDDITGGQSAFETYVLGEGIKTEIAKPYGITNSKGRIVVVDTKLGALIDINLDEQKFDYIIPNGRGALKKPLNCFILDSMIYINDIASKDIVILDKDNNFLERFGADILLKPSDVVVTNNRIYVSDMEHNQVFVFSKDNYKLLFSFPNATSEADEFLHSPTHISISGENIYITDFGEFNIKVFSLEGKYIKNIGKYGKNLGEFVRPKGIALDKEKYLYVTDAAFENVQLFNPEGKLLMFFGGPYIGQGYLNLPIRISIDYDNVDYFKDYVDDNYKIRYLIYVTNQFGPDKITVYGFLDKK